MKKEEGNVCISQNLVTRKSQEESKEQARHGSQEDQGDQFEQQVGKQQWLPVRLEEMGHCLKHQLAFWFELILMVSDQGRCLKPHIQVVPFKISRLGA